MDQASYAWLRELRADGAAREDAARRLHALLFRAARFQLGRRASTVQLRGEELDDVATEAADDALVAVLRHLDDFRGASRFTTWACKFAILEAAVALRKRAWKGRELPHDAQSLPPLPARDSGPENELEQIELVQELARAVAEVLTNRQREAFVAVALNDVPVDVVADRAGGTRGAVYKALHDARRKLRAELGRALSGSSGTARGRSSGLR